MRRLLIVGALVLAAAVLPGRPPVIVYVLLVVGLIVVWRLVGRDHDAQRPITARLADSRDLAQAGLLAAQPDPDGLLLARQTPRQGGQWIQICPQPGRPELGHVLVVGPPRSGKSMWATSQLLAWGSHAIVSDPRGELLRLTGGWRARIGRVVVLDPSSGSGQRYDPLAAKSTSAEYRAFATSLLFDPRDQQGAIYAQRGSEILAALFGAARREGVPGLVFVGRCLEQGLAATVARVPELVGGDLGWRRDVLLLGAWAGLSARLGLLLDAAALRTLSGTDLQASDFDGPLPVTAYCVWPRGASGEARAPLLRAVLLGLLQEILSVREARADPGDPVLALFDEAGSVSIPELPQLSTSAAAQRVSLAVLLQSEAQLEANYGRAGAAAIAGSLHHSIWYRPGDLETARLLEARIGQTTVELRQHNATRETLPPWIPLVTSSGTREQPWPLLPASALLDLPDLAAVVIPRGVPPGIWERADWTLDPELSERANLPSPVVVALPEAPNLSSASSAVGVIRVAEDAPAAATVLSADHLALRRKIGPVDAHGCRPWRGSFDRDGYPRAWLSEGRRWRPAHRQLVIWERGPIAVGWEVDHTCRHRWCVSLDHLEAVTKAEHRRRELARQRAEKSSALG